MLQTVERDWYSSKRARKEVKPRHPGAANQPKPKPGKPPVDVSLSAKQGAMRQRQQRRAERRPYAPIARIVSLVAAEFGLQPADLRSQSRNPVFVLPRHVAMYVARQTTRASTPDIGLAVGARHHTTVLSALRSIELKLESDQDLKDLVARMMSRIPKARRFWALVTPDSGANGIHIGRLHGRRVCPSLGHAGSTAIELTGVLLNHPLLRGLPLCECCGSELEPGSGMRDLGGGGQPSSGIQQG